ncbi:BURP domain-containing protein 3 [Acorus gramineus]|uniref:BURP domain-containing protein 3 n=1 Tax=Acorus gramineus TaxID=55184 RepID=A0AAV9B875_ACOGR|nr:BURP domain-containing protein 3 [Acorus gramineus]
MDRFRILQLLLVLSLVSTSHANLPSQMYWNIVLPDVAMPKAIIDTLHLDVMDQKDTTSLDAGHGHSIPFFYSSNGAGHHDDSDFDRKKGMSASSVDIGQGHGIPFFYSSNTAGHHDDHDCDQKKGGETSVDVGQGHGIPFFYSSNTAGHHDHHDFDQKKGVDVGQGQGIPFFYSSNAASDHHDDHHIDQTKKSGTSSSSDPRLDDPNFTLYFREESLRSESRMNLHFTKTTPRRDTFLPRRQAESLPFASTELPEVVKRLSVDPNSQQAAAMKTTLELCEEPTVRGENKTCATSLESMVDFIVSELRTNRVVAMSTTVGSEGTETRMQAYTIASMREIAGPKTVVCHPLSYAYPVFLCHGAESTKAYEVELIGEDGTTVKSAAVCHTDTSDWDPNNMALRILNIKAGSTHPVCHFFPEGHVVWTRSAN